MRTLIFAIILALATGHFGHYPRQRSAQQGRLRPQLQDYKENRGNPPPRPLIPVPEHLIKNKILEFQKPYNVQGPLPVPDSVLQIPKPQIYQPFDDQRHHYRRQYPVEESESEILQPVNPPVNPPPYRQFNDQRHHLGHPHHDPHKELGIYEPGQREKEESCSTPCHLLYDPFCGYAEQCNFNALNQCVIHNEICWRKQRNLPAFKFVALGLCPNDKPRCEVSELSGQFL